MSDILDRIRRVETTPLHGTEAWVELWKVLQDARAEIERLRSRPCPYVTGTVTKFCTLNLSENPNSSTLTDEERLRELQASAPRWIPVAARLPKEYETVLVAADGGVSAGEVRFPGGECGRAGLVRLSDVTHWMPLPAPPADAK